jgi:hypothetical protein
MCRIQLRQESVCLIFLTARASAFCLFTWRCDCRPLVLPGDFQNPSSAIGHFYDKLLQIKDRLKTEPGRQMGEARHRVVSLVTYPHSIQ